MLFAIESLALFKFKYELKICINCHIRIKRGMLRQIADLFLGEDGIVKNVGAGDLDGAGRGRKITCHDVHRGGFARAVASQKAQNLTLPDPERNAVQGANLSESLCEIVDFNHKYTSELQNRVPVGYILLWIYDFFVQHQ